MLEAKEERGMLGLRDPPRRFAHVDNSNWLDWLLVVALAPSSFDLFPLSSFFFLPLMTNEPDPRLDMGYLFFLSHSFSSSWILIVCAFCFFLFSLSLVVIYATIDVRWSSLLLPPWRFCLSFCGLSHSCSFSIGFLCFFAPFFLLSAVGVLLFSLVLGTVVVKRQRQRQW